MATAPVMRSFLNLCGKAATTACAFSAGTPAGTRAKFAALLHRLSKQPVTIGKPPQAFTYADTVSDVPPPGRQRLWQSAAVLLQQPVGGLGRETARRSRQAPRTSVRRSTA